MKRLAIIVSALLSVMNAEPLPGATVKILRLLPFTGVDRKTATPIAGSAL